MNITPANIRMWSTVGSRATYGLTALELAKEIDNLVVLTADTSTSAGLDRFRKMFPEKYVEVGIAEQNMMSIAAGLASEGMNVFTSTFSPFQTMRCCEQIKVNLGYMGHKVTMVGLASGVVLGTLGYTHCSIEDISIMRSIAGITVVSPADCTEVAKAVIAAAKHPSSVYIRLTGGAKCPVVYADDYVFEIGKAIRLRDGTDVALLATGSMVHESLRTADLLASHGISAEVWNFHTIEPIDKRAIELACEGKKLIATIEEHSIVGGLGCAVAEHKSTLRDAPPQIILGLPREYGRAGDYVSLLERHGLTASQLAARIGQSI